MRPKRDDRLLIADTAQLMKATFAQVFFLAISYKNDESEALRKDMALTLLAEFMTNGYTTELVENFCLDILTGRLPLIDDKGKCLNPPKRKRLPPGKPGKGVTS